MQIGFQSPINGSLTHWQTEPRSTNEPESLRTSQTLRSLSDTLTSFHYNTCLHFVPVFLFSIVNFSLVASLPVVRPATAVAFSDTTCVTAQILHHLKTNGNITLEQLIPTSSDISAICVLDRSRSQASYLFPNTRTPDYINGRVSNKLHLLPQSQPNGFHKRKLSAMSRSRKVLSVYSTLSLRARSAYTRTSRYPQVSRVMLQHCNLRCSSSTSLFARSNHEDVSAGCP